MRTGMGPRRVFALASLLVVCAVSAATQGQAAARPDPRSGVRASSDELSLVRKARIGSTDVYRYHQVVGGIEVLGSEAVVTVTGERSRVHSDATARDIDRPGAPDVSKAEAIAVATRAAEVTRRRGPAKANLAILPGGGGTLVWRAKVPAWEPLGDFDVLVDARNGDVLAERNVLRHATGSAALYDTNPVVENGGVYTGLKDRDDRDSPLLTGLRTPVALPRLEDAQDCLVGDHVTVTQGPKKRDVCRAGLDWSDVTRRQNDFEALMAYFHIDRVEAYVRTLGFATPGEPQRVVANGFRADNAFYTSHNDQIQLGSGGVDDGEDGDVIVHEYGHAIQDAQIPGGLKWSFAAGAMGEGFGDYLAYAASITLSGAGEATSACVFDWDAVSYDRGSPKCGRRVDSPKRLKDLGKYCRREVHCAGTVWASALRDLRLQLGAATMDEIVLRSHELMPDVPKTSFAHGVQALEDADDALNGGANVAEIHAEMEQRGLV